MVDEMAHFLLSILLFYSRELELVMIILSLFIKQISLINFFSSFALFYDGIDDVRGFFVVLFFLLSKHIEYLKQKQTHFFYLRIRILNISKWFLIKIAFPNFGSLAFNIAQACVQWTV